MYALRGKASGFPLGRVECVSLLSEPVINDVASSEIIRNKEQGNNCDTPDIMPHLVFFLVFFLFLYRLL